MSEPEGRYLANSTKTKAFLLQLRHRFEFGDENWRISSWGMMIIENIKSFWDFCFFLDFFRGHQKKSRVFLGFSSMKNMGKHKEITGEPYENMIFFFGGLEKIEKKSKISKTLYIFNYHHTS